MHGSQHGYSLTELVFVAGAMAVAAGAAAPQLLAGMDEWRTLGAVRYLSSRLYQARMEAASRNADTALRFAPAADGYAFATIVDGNRNGVRAADVLSGLDRVIRPAERLPDKFAGVEFGALAGLPAVEAGAPPPGSDPIRLGAGDQLTFTPLGSSTPGSLYVRGRGQVQYVLRIFGETGKIRILRFHPGTRQWKQL